MSKPTPNYFCVHTGFFRNDRTLSLHERIGDRAFHVMPMIWSWAGENQMDGDVSHVTLKQWHRIFRSNNLILTLPQTRRIVDALHAVGFIQDGKLHSWDKFNRQFVEFDYRRAVRQAAANTRWTNAVEKNTHQTNGNGNGNGGGSKQLWMIEQALKTAKGKAKRELLKQREALLSEHTGVDLSEPAQTQNAPAKPERKPRRGKLNFSALREAAGMKAEEHNPVPE